jgi:superoxide dismutase
MEAQTIPTPTPVATPTPIVTPTPAPMPVSNEPMIQSGAMDSSKMADGGSVNDDSVKSFMKNVNWSVVSKMYNDSVTNKYSHIIF